MTAADCFLSSSSSFGSPIGVQLSDQILILTAESAEESKEMKNRHEWFKKIQERNEEELEDLRRRVKKRETEIKQLESKMEALPVKELGLELEKLKERQDRNLHSTIDIRTDLSGLANLVEGIASELKRNQENLGIIKEHWDAEKLEQTWRREWRSAQKEFEREHIPETKTAISPSPEKIAFQSPPHPPSETARPFQSPPPEKMAFLSLPPPPETARPIPFQSPPPSARREEKKPDTPTSPFEKKVFLEPIANPPQPATLVEVTPVESSPISQTPITTAKLPPQPPVTTPPAE
jgi:hypothetical protein